MNREEAKRALLREHKMLTSMLVTAFSTEASVLVQRRREVEAQLRALRSQLRAEGGVQAAA